MHNRHQQIEIETGEGIALHDLTPELRTLVAASNMRSGFVAVSSRHTTTALTVNENEQRLLDDVRNFLTRLIPPGAGYRHDDIQLRDCPPDEPRNAHAHLAAMLLGSSEVIPIIDGTLALGTYQSLLLIELDGPRSRRISVQLVGE